jgi:nucleotide-binding universal stress UspA family protein
MRENLARPSTVLIPLLNLSVAPAMLGLAAALIAGPDLYLPPAARIVVVAVVTVPTGQLPEDGRNMARAYRAMLGYLPSQATVPTPLSAAMAEPLRLETRGGLPVRRDSDHAALHTAHPALTVPVHTLIKVAHDLETGIREAARAEAADLLLLHWKGYSQTPGALFGATLDMLVAAPPCNLLLVRPGSDAPLDVARRVLLPLRGGPTAELALELGRSLADRIDVPVRVLHSVPPLRPARNGDAPYQALQQRMGATGGHRMPVEQRLTLTTDAPGFVADEIEPGDLVLIGIPEGPQRPAARGPVLDAVLADPTRPVLMARAARPLDLPTYLAQLRAQPEIAWTAAQWFVENTYRYDEFLPGRRPTPHGDRPSHVSLVVPTHDDVTRIGLLLLGLRRSLQEGPEPAIHEILVADAASTDGTAEKAAAARVPVRRVPPSGGGRPGPAAQLAAAVDLAAGDIMVWFDPKTTQLQPGDVPALVGPLLADPNLLLVKPFWPGEDAEGRIHAHTLDDLLAMSGPQLSALPVWAWLGVFYPRLGAVHNPLGRPFAARRSLLRELAPMLQEAEVAAGHLHSDTAFTAGLLLETATRWGTRAIAQVELPARPRRRPIPTAHADMRPAGGLADLLTYLAARPDTIEAHTDLAVLRDRILRVSA